ncbi:CoA ester lyase [Bradyrhizobium sp. ISRA442]|uniref:HpcH/HpaI aldolase/citrate lyase family protein n=1 Tax=Bradyrhizobium sp. ISRA442 TaxID=2866197 RepID=UPI00311AD2E8
MTRPRRSVLFVPGSNARALEKARDLRTDGLVLDLEDSVASDAKTRARGQIAEAIKARGFGNREVLIRINALDSAWWHEDVRMAAQVAPDGILVPKVSSVAQLSSVAELLAASNGAGFLSIWVIIETPWAVSRVEELAAAARDLQTGVAGFVFGPNDMSRETRIRMVPGRATMMSIIIHCMLAARAHGLEMLDGPYSDFSNPEGFALECRQARDLGFDGKTLIHPSQIDICNAIFTPSAEELGEARRIIAAFNLPENASHGAIELNGKMVERLHAEMAKRTIAVADAIAAATA